MPSTPPLPDLTGLEIAVIGMAGRFPGAPSLDIFWHNLCTGVESITHFSDAELLAAGVAPHLLYDPAYVKASAVIDGIDQFDAAFFGMSPREADLTDPQHRLFLECAWEALEHAGYAPLSYPGAIGLFAGAGMSNYAGSIYPSAPGAVSSDADQLWIGTLPDFLATRVSYKLNLRGPSVTVQTACSTGLVAVHLAGQSLLSGDCDMALAGAVSIQLPQIGGYEYQPGGISSPDGHCRPFDADARGTVQGSGAGVVVLKRLEAALDDGDHILALIKGSAINNDGAVKVGYTAPSVAGQVRVIQAAHQLADVDPTTISYVEAHGTATPMGDPIEIAALTQAFRTRTARRGYCTISALKGNIGHLDAAAGIAGLIKTILALQHGQIPPTAHFAHPNPAIDFASSPFYVNAALADWPASAAPRRAGVSAFGIGGTNAHVILEEALPTVAPSAARPWQVLVLSARTSTALDQATANLAAHVRRHPALPLADIAYTLQTGRQPFAHRRMLVCRNRDDAVTALEACDPARVVTRFVEQPDRPVVFMCSGQGAQYVNMTRGLYETESAFRAVIDQCAELLRPHLGLDLRDVLYPDLKIEDRRWRIEGSESSILHPLSSILDLDQTQYTQPALFVIEYALAQLWMSWGVRPTALIGHSIGEYVAACLAGVFSLDDALALVAARGRLVQRLPAGAMLAVAQPPAALQPLLGDQLALAAINGPSRCVVAGPAEAVAALQQRLAAAEVSCRRLRTSHAFHSPMIEPILAAFAELVARVRLNAPCIPYISNVTGTWITAAEATDPQYWVRHLRQPVRFSDGIDVLAQEPQRLFLEVGPGQMLSTLVEQQLHCAPGSAVFPSLRHPSDPQPDEQVLLTTLGKLWLAGATLDWASVSAQNGRQRVPLPTYPFERQRHWIVPQNETPTPQQTASGTRLGMAEWFSVPSWKRSPLSAPGVWADNATQQRWLVFVDAYNLGSQVARRLREADQEVITVQIGQRFAQIDHNAYELNPRRRADYLALLEAIRTRAPFPSTILHLWGVASDEHIRPTGDNDDNLQDLSFCSVLFLVQALGEWNIADPVRIEVVSSNVQEVSGDEILYPEKAMVLGLCKVVPREYPAFTCRSIDVVLPKDRGRSLERLADQLLAEFTTPSPERVIALRGQYRWVQTFEPIRLDDSRSERSPLRNGGVYVIAGVYNELDHALAVHLARTAQATCILIGSAASSRLAAFDHSGGVAVRLWGSRLPHPPDAAVCALDADLSDHEQMREAISQVHERFGGIHGVIYLAGVPAQARPSEIAYARGERWCGPALEELPVLEQVLQGAELDFCVILSSLAAMIGETSDAAAPTAHEFIQAFTHRRNRTGPTPWVHVSWEGWPLICAPEHPTDVGMKNVQPAMAPEDAITALQHVLSLGVAGQVIVSATDLHIRMTCETQRSQQEPETPPVTPAPASLHARPALSTAYVAPRNEREARLAEIFQTALGIATVSVHDNFFALGGDSLLAVQLVAQMRAVLAIDLTPHSLLHAPTIAELAALAATPGSPAAPCTPLVAIQPEGTKPPLFLVHPVGGGVYIYRELAHLLGPDQPVYGVQALGFDGDAAPLMQIEEMAARYLEAIRAQQPNGPYLLGGSSFGGVVAFEIAQQLQASGQEAALLTLIDSPTPRLLPDRSVDDHELLAQVLGSERALPPELFQVDAAEEQLRPWLEQARAGGSVPAGVGTAEFRRFLDMLRGHAQALRSYRPRGYPGKLVFFRATEHERYTATEMEQHWRALAEGGFTLYDVPGSHTTMNYAPNVQVMAEWLGKYLG